MEIINKFEELIQSHEKIAVVGHFNPDGDALGSITAITFFLKSLGKEVYPVLPSPYPEAISFLDLSKEVLTPQTDIGDIEKIFASSELIICADFNKLSRTESLSDLIRKSPAKKLLIDHHPNPEENVFDLIISDPSSSSTCELIFWTLLNTSIINLDPKKLSKDILTSLGTGLVTDTNNFSNSTTHKTFEMAAIFSREGISLEGIYRKVSGNYTEKRMRLLGDLLFNKLIIKDDAAFIVVTEDLQNKYNYKTGDTEGIVNMPLMIKNINISGLFIETNEYIKVSLRSKNDFSVNQFSMKYFNGGGHEKAAGGRYFGSINELEDYFFTALDEYKLSILK